MSLITYNKVVKKLIAAETYRRVKELDSAKGIVWLNASNANNTDALATRADDTSKKGITTMSQLAEAVNTSGDLTLALNARVDVDMVSIENVAAEFLKEQSLM